MIDAINQYFIESTVSVDIEDSVNSLKELKLLDSSYEIDKEISVWDNASAIAYQVAEADSNYIIWFDGECIENQDDYASLTRTIFSHFSIPISDVQSEFNIDNRTASVLIKSKDKVFKKEWIQDGDWVEEEYIEFIFDIFIEEFEKYAMLLPSSDQCIGILVIEALDKYKCISDLLDIEIYGINKQIYFAGMFLSILFTHGLGFIITTLLALFVTSFLKGLLGSAVVWSVFGLSRWFYESFKFNKNRKAKEKTQLEVKENPEEFGRMIGEMAVKEMYNKTTNESTKMKMKAIMEVNEKYSKK